MTIRLVALLSLTLLIAGCGFHLRGSDASGLQFPFMSLHVKSAAETPFVTELRRMLTSRQIVQTDISQADITLEIVSEQTSKQILALSGSGRVKEYQLFYRVSLHAFDKQLNPWLAADEIVLTRILPYDDTLILAKEQEEAALYKDMRSDAITQILRRLSRAKLQSPNP